MTHEPARSHVLHPYSSAAERLALEALLLDSYQQHVGDHCPFAPDPWNSGLVVLCHDGAVGNADGEPRFVYANLSAQRVFKRSAEEFAGLPSSLSAPPLARKDRQDQLSQATKVGVLRDYHGTRVDSEGGLFEITGATIWLVGSRSPIGQAACFPPPVITK